MLAADDGESPVRASGSGAGHAFSRPSRCASRYPQPSPSPSPGPMSARAPRPRVPAARQIDHTCAPERWAPKEDDGRAERRISLAVVAVDRFVDRAIGAYSAMRAIGGTAPWYPCS